MTVLWVKKRMKNLAITFSVLLVMLAVWLIYLNIAHGEEYAKAASEQQTKDITVSAKRGTIYDRNGKQLAVSVSANTVIFRSCRDQEKRDCGKDLDRAFGNSRYGL